MVFPGSAYPQLPPAVLTPRQQPRHCSAAAAAAAAAQASAGTSIGFASLRCHHCYV
jgi:hypothetical protein